MVRGVLSSRGAAAAVIDAAIQGRFQVITSYRLLEELADVLRRPRIAEKYRLDASRLAGVLDLIEIAEVVPGIPRRRFVEEDPGDDWVVAAALEAKAEAIVTEDRALLRAENFEGVRTMTSADFLQVLGRPA